MAANSGEVDPTESQGADQVTGAPQGGDKDAQDAQKLVQGMLTISQAMQTFGDNLQGVVPPEGMKALQAAISAYHQFLAIAEKAMGVSGTQEEGGEQPSQASPRATQGPQSAMTQGQGSAVSADMPQRKGMVPA